MPDLPNLKNRLHLLGITAETVNATSHFQPFLFGKLDRIAIEFYQYLGGFPEASKLLHGIDIKNSLKPRQVEHWKQLFSCKFDDQFVAYAVRIGQVHYQHNVAPYIYMAGYNFLHCKLINLALQVEGKSLDLKLLLPSIARLISLDMDLALSAYTREYWRNRERAGGGGTPPHKVKDSRIEYIGD